MGGAKPTLALNGRMLISYPLAALSGALGTVAVVAKRDSKLPALPGVEVWTEPDEPRHPLTGIVHALRVAEGRPVMVCAVDLPLAGADLVRSLAFAERGAAPAVVACGDHRLQPTLACYAAAALDPLSAALKQPGRPLTEVVRALEPKLVEVPDRDQLLNINTPADLARAEAILDRRGRRQPNVKS